MNNKKLKKRKVATLTFHLAYNFGAMLQAYALQCAIAKLGFDCEILHYRFKPIDVQNGLDTYLDMKQKLGFLRGTISYFASIQKGYYAKQNPMQKRFFVFMHKKLRHSKKTYFTPESLKEAKYDVFVLGSDQIWNPLITEGLASEYFGAYFDTSNSKVISYAASCGTKNLPEKYTEEIVGLLQNIQHISTREDGFTQYLNDNYKLNAKTVLDPVFLLETKDWDRLLRKARTGLKDPYLLVYAFEVGDDVYNLARKIAKERNLVPVMLDYKYKAGYSDFKQFVDCGPLEFLSLVRNASFVCTSSFHGEAFSILFNRNFYCVPHPKYYQRNIDLLKLMGLESRLILKYDNDFKVSNCDFTEVNVRLETLRQKSLQFLLDSI